MLVEQLLRTLREFDIHKIFPSLDTLYSKYTTSNYVASDSEIPIIRDVVSQHREQLNAIESIIEQVEPLLAQLRNRREKILSSMKVHEGCTSCIRRIPSDILREIFLQCLPDDKYHKPDAKTPQLLLTQVCRRWREVALDTPRLWCSLSITETSRDPQEQIGFYHDYWLKNARLFPLSLQVYLGYDIHGPLWTKTAIDFMRLCTSRCTELCIHFDDADGLSRLLEEIPLLERLTLIGDLGSMEQPTSLVQPQSRLHTLTIVNTDSSAPRMEVLSTFDPGWTNLTRLAVSYQSEDDVGDRIFFTLLQMCPNIEHFVISHVFLYNEDDAISLTHSKLRVLDVGIVYGINFLDTLTVPNLHHLLIGDIQDIDPRAVLDCNPMPSLDLSGQPVFDIVYSGCVGGLELYALFTILKPNWTELTHITLAVQIGASNGLLPCQFCPRLETLIVTFFRIKPIPDMHFTHPKLSSLTIATSSGCVGVLLDMLTLPNLHHLDLTVAKDSDWPHTKFEDLVARSKCPLEMLKITAPRISMEEREELTSLIPTLILDLYDLGISESSADAST